MASWRLPKRGAEDEAAAPGGGGARRRKTGRAAETAGVMVDEEPEDRYEEVEAMDIEEVIKLLVKGQLILHQQIREITAGSWVTYECKMSEFIKAAVEAGRDYNQEVKERGKGHKLGSPHIHTLLAALEAPLPTTIDDKVGHQMKQLTSQLIQRGKTYIVDHFYHFRVKEMFQKTAEGEPRYKVEFGLNMFGQYDMDLEAEGLPVKGLSQAHHIYQLLDKTVVAAGGKKLSGPPPRGPIERQLSRFLARKGQQLGKAAASHSEEATAEGKKKKEKGGGKRK